MRFGLAGIRFRLLLPLLWVLQITPFADVALWRRYAGAARPNWKRRHGSRRWANS